MDASIFEKHAPQLKQLSMLPLTHAPISILPYTGSFTVSFTTGISTSNIIWSTRDCSYACWRLATKPGTALLERRFSSHVLQSIETVEEWMSSKVSKMTKFFGNSSKWLNVESCLQYGYDKKNLFWVRVSELVIVKMQTRHNECPQCKTWALFWSEKVSERILQVINGVFKLSMNGCLTWRRILLMSRCEHEWQRALAFLTEEIATNSSPKLNMLYSAVAQALSCAILLHSPNRRRAAAVHRGGCCASSSWWIISPHWPSRLWQWQWQWLWLWQARRSDRK